MTWSLMLCSLPVAPEDAASPMKAKHSRPSPFKAPAPPVSKFCVDPARVNTLLGSNRSAFSNTALKSKSYLSNSLEATYGVPTPSPDPQGSPQGGPKGISRHSPQGRAALQHAATMLRWPPADSLFHYTSTG